MIKNQHQLKKGQIPWNKGKKLGFTPKFAFKKGHKPDIKAIEATKARVENKHPRWADGRKVSSSCNSRKNNKVINYVIR